MDPYVDNDLKDIEAAVREFCSKEIDEDHLHDLEDRHVYPMGAVQEDRGPGDHRGRFFGGRRRFGLRGNGAHHHSHGIVPEPARNGYGAQSRVHPGFCHRCLRKRRPA